MIVSSSIKSGVLWKKLNDNKIATNKCNKNKNKLYNEKVVDLVTLSGASQERARIQTQTDHGLVDGDQVVFKNMGGMVEIEGQTAFVKNVAQTDVALDGKVIELYRDADLLELWDIRSSMIH